MTILVTGGYGFIGSNFIHYVNERTDEHVVNVDAKTYAANPKNLDGAKVETFEVDIADSETMSNIISMFEPRLIINFAAQTHVDNSIVDPLPFEHSNVYGALQLLEVVRKYRDFLNYVNRNHNFQFIHVSTDEVFGSLNDTDPPFNLKTPYAPRSPYAASKAASDHFVKAYINTYKIPAVITNCSNNFGPRQHSEKFIPTIIRKVLAGEKVPVYGTGKNVRDWLYVDDHCDALWRIAQAPYAAEQYLIGGGTELKNITLANLIVQCMVGNTDGIIELVEDRPGHDWRYAIDNSMIYNHLGWKPQTKFYDGLIKTIEWYRNEYKENARDNSSSRKIEQIIASNGSDNEATASDLR